MIFVAVGANLDTDEGGPLDTCRNAIKSLETKGIMAVRTSSWYVTEPVPRSAQPEFINGILGIETAHDPRRLLRALHATEAEFGRERRFRNAARTLDLDLIDYRGRVSGPGGWPRMPHPRMDDRAFVLVPLLEIAPDWRHPATGEPGSAMLARLPRARILRLPNISETA